MEEWQWDMEEWQVGIAKGQSLVEAFHEKINSDDLNCAMWIENLAEGS